MLTSLLGISAVCVCVCTQGCVQVLMIRLPKISSRSACVCVMRVLIALSVIFRGTTHVQPSQATYTMQWHHHAQFALHCISKRNGQYGVDMTRANRSDMHGHCFSRIGCLPCALSLSLSLCLSLRIHQHRIYQFVSGKVHIDIAVERPVRVLCVCVWGEEAFICNEN